MTKVFLIGAGPGDPELLTLKAFRLLGKADVVLYDSLVDDRIVGMARPDAVIFDVGKRCGKHSVSQAEICKLLLAQAKTGKMVVRLKGGDPMVFGRATEEMAVLEANGITYEIVPGITAATAAAAALKLSLTRRGIARSLHFVTGHGAEGGLPAHDFVSLTKSGGTLVIYMGSETLVGLASHFIEAGMDPMMPAVAVENASLPDQHVVYGTIGSLPSLLGQSKRDGPIVILVGDAMQRGAEVYLNAAQLKSAKALTLTTRD